jgi:NIPSNAP.
VLPGQFADADDADRFVWLRGFADMAARARALAAFYDGPVWRAHREEANATMIDSDDVLLLRPRQPFDLRGLERPTAGVAAAAGPVVAMVCPLRPGSARAVEQSFETRLRPRLEAHGAWLLGSYVTEPAATISRACRCAKASRCSSGSPASPTRPVTASGSVTWARIRPRPRRLPAGRPSWTVRHSTCGWCRPHARCCVVAPPIGTSRRLPECLQTSTNPEETHPLRDHREIAS